MKIIKRTGLLVLLSLAGAILMYLYVSASQRGAFIPWESRGKPPEKAIQVLAVDYVKTQSGAIYKNCGNDCWIQSDQFTPNGEYLPLKSCGKLPALAGSIDFKAICRNYGLGVSLNITAIDNIGTVYSWDQIIGEEGEGLVLLLSPFIGAVAGFLLGCIILLMILFSDFLGWLQIRAHQKGSRDHE